VEKVWKPEREVGVIAEGVPSSHTTGFCPINLFSSKYCRKAMEMAFGKERMRM
jgi:hypothetical protein